LALAHLALAKAELHAPAELQGAFIAAGHSFDAFAAVGKALGTATGDVFIIDPYADAKLLTDYAPLAPETVSVRVLTEATHSKALKPAAEHWRQQMQQPLEVRLGARAVDAWSLDTGHCSYIVMEEHSLSDAAHPLTALFPTLRWRWPRTLHDRLILIDGKTAFVLGQSFKDSATRAHTSLVRMPPDAGKLKIEAYELMWSSATPL
jgi:hypothetical protein